MKIGLYFGSFNPIHAGHLIIANYILNEIDIDKIWFVVSPQNPFKHSASLLNEHNRLHLVRLAIENDNRIKAVDIEFHLPKPSYTVNTLTYLQEKYPENQFLVIMGSDSFQNLKKWKNYEVIIKNYPILIYKRSSFEINNDIGANIQVLNAPLIDISSTEIRSLVQNGKSIHYLVPETVREEIEACGYYKKSNKISHDKTGDND